MQRAWYCYFIQSTNPRFSSYTYVGITNNLKRRLRQHNGELVGGAKATKGKGPWEFVCVLSGFPDETNLRQFEWRMHRLSRRSRGGMASRIRNLKKLLEMKKWTKGAQTVDLEDLIVMWNNKAIETVLHEDVIVCDWSI